MRDLQESVPSQFCWVVCRKRWFNFVSSLNPFKNQMMMILIMMMTHRKTWTSWVGFKHSHGVWVFSCKFEISIGTCYSCIYHIFLRSFSTLFRFCPPCCQRLSATLSGHWDLWSCCQRATWGEQTMREMDGNGWEILGKCVWNQCNDQSFCFKKKVVDCLRHLWLRQQFLESEMHKEVDRCEKKSLLGFDHSMLLIFMNFKVWYHVTSSDCLKNIWCQVSTTCNRTANSKSCIKGCYYQGPKNAL